LFFFFFIIIIVLSFLRENAMHEISLNYYSFGTLDYNFKM